MKTLILNEEDVSYLTLLLQSFDGTIQEQSTFDNRMRVLMQLLANDWDGEIPSEIPFVPVTADPVPILELTSNTINEELHVYLNILNGLLASGEFTNTRPECVVDQAQALTDATMKNFKGKI